MMKVVQLVTQMEAGGAQRVAMLLFEALRQRGYDSEVWFLYLKRPTYKNVVGVRTLLEHKPSPLDYLKISIRLQQLLRSHHPDVIISHTHYANIMGQSIARLCSVPHRIAVQHSPVENYPKVAKWVDRILGSTDFYSANIAVSQVVIDSLASYPSKYQKYLSKIYNGIPDVSRKNSLATIRARWNLPEHVPLLIHVGRLAQVKNQSTLIKTLLHLPDAHLILIGEGELRAELEQQVATLQLTQRVHFLGEMNSEDVFDLLAISNVFVFASLYEAMPMAIVEAMGLGIPIVAGDIPATREVIGDAGIFVPLDNAEAIAVAVRQILESPELASHLRQCSLQRSTLFSIEQMVGSYEQLFR